MFEMEIVQKRGLVADGWTHSEWLLWPMQHYEPQTKIWDSGSSFETSLSFTSLFTERAFPALLEWWCACKTQLQRHKMKIACWCVCPTHQMLIACRCVSRVTRVHTVMLYWWVHRVKRACMPAVFIVRACKRCCCLLVEACNFRVTRWW